MTLLTSDGDELRAERDDFARAVFEGLGRSRKELPCRYLYDARGSELFEEITELEEYYPTRTEARILRDAAGEIAARTQAGACLIEFGSGSSTKTEILLDALPGLGAYIAVDVSESALDDARLRLRDRYPKLRLETVVADFWAPVELPRELASRPRLGFFPGSTIGNLEPTAAQQLMAHFGDALGPGGRLVIGVDVEKDPSILIPAYNDARGVTAAFNLNLLMRINRELDADFEVAAFRHEAVWNARLRRVEMHLESLRDQTVTIDGRAFRFARGETIHTENSHKWRVADFHAMAERAGWSVAGSWSDPERLFSVHEFHRPG